MTRFWTVSGVITTTVSIVIAGLAVRVSAKPSPLTATTAVPASLVHALDGNPAYRGAGSCAASACHGGTEPVPAQVSDALRNEHTTWVTSDPHAGAFDVLLSERSQRIAKNLGKKSGKIIEAHLDSRCLACHATPSPSGSEQPDGVSCESCHGASRDWLSEHTTVGWKGSDKASRGFRDLRNNAVKASTCVGCHVGSAGNPEDKALGIPVGDMNHDFIAAGHPRLNWEFSAYSANYPKHWRIPAQEAAEIDARLWLIGQVATMIASLDLLDARAVEAGKKAAPWPELSEYGCFSCHFSLKDKLRQESRDPEVSLGVPAWGSWNTPMLKLLSKNYPGSLEIEPQLRDLRLEMAKLRSDPETVRKLVAELKKPLQVWLDGQAKAESPVSADVVDAMYKVLSAKVDGKSPHITGWDSAAQTYLGLTALNASRRALDPSKPDASDELKAMLKALEFKPGFDSPRDGK